MPGISEPDLVKRRVVVREPQFASRRSAALLVALGYVSLVAFAAVFLGLLEASQAYDDDRNIDATVIYAFVLAFPFGRAFLHSDRSYVIRLALGAHLGLAAGMGAASLLALVKFMNPISALGILLVLTVAGMILIRRR